MTRDSIYAIADKRVSNADLSFVHDNEVKLRPIKNDLFLTGIGECDISDFWHQTLKSISHFSVSEILTVATQLPRKKQVLYSEEYPFCPVVIFGLDGNGELFLWLGHPDGRTEVIKSSSNITCKIIGMNDDNSPGTTVNKISEYSLSLLMKGGDIEETLINSLQYGASIDPVVSPTYDYLKLSKNLILN